MVHIGAAKTATTYIQHALYDNAALLESAGVYIPRAGRYEYSLGTIVHHHLAWEVVEPERFNPEIGGWEKLAAEVQGVDADTILVSAESLQRMIYTEENRQLLERRLKQISDDVTVLFVLRDQLSAINSMYNQRVKSLRYTDTFDAHVAHALESKHFDLDHLFSSWYASDLLTLVAVSFLELIADDPFVRFLRAAGISIPEDRITSSDSTNASLGPVGVEILRLLGAYLRVFDPEFDPKGDAAMDTYRIAAKRARNNGWANEKHWGWDREQAERAAEQFAASNQHFAQTMWNKEWTIPMPVTKPQSIARLTDLAADERIVMQRFINGMVKVYVELINDPRYVQRAGETA